MAGPACMSEDGRPAVFVGTMLETGDSVALCDICLVGWAAALLNVMTGVDPTPFLEAVSETEPAPAEIAGDGAGGPPAETPADSDPGAAQEAAATAGGPSPTQGKRRGRTPQNRPGRMSDESADPGTAAGPADNGGTRTSSNPSPAE